MPTWFGYSRLIALHDIGTLSGCTVADVIDQAIEEHGGRIVQTGADSLLITFDSIDGAARCAIKMRRQVPIHDVHSSALVVAREISAHDRRSAKGGWNG